MTGAMEGEWGALGKGDVEAKEPTASATFSGAEADRIYVEAAGFLPICL